MRRRIADLALDHTLQRSGTERRVVSVVGQLRQRGVGDVERQAALGHPLAQMRQLDRDDPREVVLGRATGSG